MASTKTETPVVPIPSQALRAAASEKLDNEARASRGGNACLQRHGTEFFRHIVQQRWSAAAEAK